MVIPFLRREIFLKLSANIIIIIRVFLRIFQVYLCFFRVVPDCLFFSESAQILIIYVTLEHIFYTIPRRSRFFDFPNFMPFFEDLKNFIIIQEFRIYCYKMITFVPLMRKITVLRGYNVLHFSLGVLIIFTSKIGCTQRTSPNNFVSIFGCKREEYLVPIRENDPESKFQTAHNCNSVLPAACNVQKNIPNDRRAKKQCIERTLIFSSHQLIRVSKKWVATNSGEGMMRGAYCGGGWG